MPVITRPYRHALIPALSALLAVVPACSASAGHKWGLFGPRSTPDGRVALRPAFPPPGRTKPLYLSGYAGATYAPLRPYNPTSYTAGHGHGHPFGHHFGHQTDGR